MSDIDYTSFTKLLNMVASDLVKLPPQAKYLVQLDNNTSGKVTLKSLLEGLLHSGSEYVVYEFEGREVVSAFDTQKRIVRPFTNIFYPPTKVVGVNKDNFITSTHGLSGVTEEPLVGEVRGTAKEGFVVYSRVPGLPGAPGTINYNITITIYIYYKG